MSNKFDEMRAAVQEAESTIKAADNVAGSMARMLIGRLRKVDSSYTLQQLKKELSKFNAHTGRWIE